MGNRSSRARRSKPAMRNREFTSTPPACKRKTMLYVIPYESNIEKIFCRYTVYIFGSKCLLSTFLSHSSVYPTCNWDEKHIVRMESQKLIGPRQEPSPALEDICGTHECGICFNVSRRVCLHRHQNKYRTCIKPMSRRTHPINMVYIIVLDLFCRLSKAC